MLRGFLHGELRWLDSRRCAGHVRRCAACRDRLEELARLGRESASLLRRLEPRVDAAEAWRRFAAVTVAARPRTRTPVRRLAPRVAFSAAVAGVVLAAVFVLRPRSESSIPARSLPEAAIQDLCCWDLDGGGPADDGVLAVVLPQEQVVALTIYEDGNGSGSLSGRDPIRYASSPAGSSRWAVGGWSDAGDDAAPLVVRDFCCADHDLGGPADDGVLTVSVDDVIRRVLLYEDLDGSRSFSPGDALRWNGGGALP